MISKTAMTYGGALYDLAREESLEEQILGELHAVSDLFRQNPDYTKLLILLCDNGTISALPDCFEAFRGRYNRDHDIIDVCAVSAVPLTEAQAARLREKLEAKCKKHVELTVRTDASLLGGIRLELPDRQLDGTVQSHLNQIQQLLESSSL